MMFEGDERSSKRHKNLRDARLSWTSTGYRYGLLLNIRSDSFFIFALRAGRLDPRTDISDIDFFSFLGVFYFSLFEITGASATISESVAGSTFDVSLLK